MPTVYLLVLVSSLWVALSGHYTLLINAFGVVSVLTVVLLCRAMKILDAEIAPLYMTWPTLRHLPWLTWEVLKSNADVAWRVLHPKLPIAPRVIEVTAPQRSDLGRATYANSITLTPGTLTMNADGDTLTVHAISEDAAELLATGEMGRRITDLERGHV